MKKNKINNQSIEPLRENRFFIEFKDVDLPIWIFDTVDFPKTDSDFLTITSIEETNISAFDYFKNNLQNNKSEYNLEINLLSPEGFVVKTYTYSVNLVNLHLSQLNMNSDELLINTMYFRIN